MSTDRAARGSRVHFSTGRGGGSAPPAQQEVQSGRGPAVCPQAVCPQAVCPQAVCPQAVCPQDVRRSQARLLFVR
ncbi:unnamed protein product [Lota lota]